MFRGINKLFHNSCSVWNLKPFQTEKQANLSLQDHLLPFVDLLLLVKVRRLEPLQDGHVSNIKKPHNTSIIRCRSVIYKSILWLQMTMGPAWLSEAATNNSLPTLCSTNCWMRKVLLRTKRGTCVLFRIPAWSRWPGWGSGGPPSRWRHTPSALSLSKQVSGVILGSDTVEDKDLEVRETDLMLASIFLPMKNRISFK